MNAPKRRNLDDWEAERGIVTSDPMSSFNAWREQQKQQREAAGGDALYSVQPTSRDQAIHAGERALDELPAVAKEQIWDRWMQVAAGLEAVQQEAMFVAQTNEPTGARYAKTYKEIVKRHRYDRINSSDRSRLLECLRNRAAIEAWLAALPTNKRLKIAHPLVILRKWKTTLPPDPNKSERKKTPTLAQKHAEVLEENHRLKQEIERGGGDLWAPKDTAAQIARAVIDRLTSSKAEKVAREMLMLAAEKKKREDEVRAAKAKS
jgi:hypothetical protein